MNQEQTDYYIDGVQTLECAVYKNQDACTQVHNNHLDTSTNYKVTSGDVASVSLLFIPILIVVLIIYLQHIRQRK